MIEIKNRWTGAVIMSLDLQTLVGADLSSADLSRADLRRANLPTFQLVTKGTMKVYKKASGKVVELIIPSQAKRTSSLIGRKCRCEYAYVKRILTVDGEPHITCTSVAGNYDSSTVYEIGKKVVPDEYDDDIRVECSHGIHFFITFEEAATYN